ncbi:MAG: FIST N-terminal domain-containing protein [Myxococcota bacterium]|nr:FIST N-terminal domain-containing protein [Myxococcota bacterium]
MMGNVVRTLEAANEVSFLAASSADPDGYRATIETLERIAAGMPDADAVLLAVSAAYSTVGVERALREKAAGLPLVGASATSVIGESGWIERGVSALAIRRPAGGVRIGSIDGVRDMTPEAFADAAAAAIPLTAAGTLVILFADALVPDYDAKLRALGARRPDLLSCGACSSFDTSLGPGDPGFLTNWQAFGGSIRRDSLVFAAFENAAGRLGAACTFAHGFQQIGRPARVTRTEGSTIFEIDGRPARDHFRRYIGDSDLRIDGYANMVCFSVSRSAAGIATPQYSLPLEFLPDGSVRVLNSVPAGSEIVLCTTTRRDLVDAARSAAARVVRSMAPAHPGVLLIFSCGGRQMVLGRRCEQEIAAIREEVGRDVPVFGFYSGGEFAPDPDAPGGGMTIHNAYSATLCALRCSATGRPGGT